MMLNALILPTWPAGAGWGYASGVWAALVMVLLLSPKRLRAELIVTLCVCGLFGVVGARLWAWLWMSDRALEQLWSWSAPLASLGLLGGAAVGFLVLWWRHPERGLALDVIVPSSALALALARAECHMRGCDFGVVAPASAPLSVIYWQPSLATMLLQAGQPLHPMPLYLSAWTLTLTMIALWRCPGGSGLRAWWIIVAYLTGRLLIEQLRHPLTRGVAWQVSLALMAVTLSVLVLGRLAWHYAPHTLKARLEEG